MKKIIKIGFPIACVAVIGGTFYLLNRTLNKVNYNNEKKDNAVNAEISNEELSNISGNLTENLSNENLVYSYTVDTEEDIAVKKEMVEENKKKAIEFVKKKDGERNEKVYYTNESVDENGYVVAVRRASTTEAIIYYIVDLETEKVEVYY